MHVATILLPAMSHEQAGEIVTRLSAFLAGEGHHGLPIFVSVMSDKATFLENAITNAAGLAVVGDGGGVHPFPEAPDLPELLADDLA